MIRNKWDPTNYLGCTCPTPAKPLSTLIMAVLLDVTTRDISHFDEPNSNGSRDARKE